MTPSPERVSVRIPRDTYYLRLVRQVIVELAHRVGFGDDATAEIEMAVDEACANAIRHADGPGRGIALEPPQPPPGVGLAAPIAVEAAAGPGGLTITLTDGGAPFAFERCGAVDVESYLAARTPSGLGVYIIKHFMDEVEYRHRPEVGNEIRMTKYLVSAASSAASKR